MAKRQRKREKNK